MHELAICQELVKATLAELERLGRADVRLRRVRVRVGALRQIVPESLRFAYEVLTKDTPAAGSELEIVTVPVVVRCRTCGWSGEIAGHFFVCGGCGAVGVEVIAGEETYLESLEIETDDS